MALFGGPVQVCSCGDPMELGVHQSAAGWYIGFWCDRCGPYSRESGYFGTEAGAKDELKYWKERPNGKV